MHVIWPNFWKASQQFSPANKRMEGEICRILSEMRWWWRWMMNKPISNKPVAVFQSQLCWPRLGILLLAGWLLVKLDNREAGSSVQNLADGQGPAWSNLFNEQWTEWPLTVEYNAVEYSTCDERVERISLFPKPNFIRLNNPHSDNSCYTTLTCLERKIRYHSTMTIHTLLFWSKCTASLPVVAITQVFYNRTESISKKENLGLSQKIAPARPCEYVWTCAFLEWTTTKNFCSGSQESSWIQLIIVSSAQQHSNFGLIFFQLVLFIADYL